MAFSIGSVGRVTVSLLRSMIIVLKFYKLK
jgi:hypothetical protein